MKELIRALSPVRRRLRAIRARRGLATGLTAGLGAALVLMILSFWLPIPDKWIWMGALAGGGSVLGAVINGLRPVTPRMAAQAADALGLKERTVTALELTGDNDSGASENPMCALQRADALEALGKLNPREIPAGSVWKRLAAGALCLLLAQALKIKIARINAELHADN